VEFGHGGHRLMGSLANKASRRQTEETQERIRNCTHLPHNILVRKCCQRNDVCLGRRELSERDCHRDKSI
jgi:hypothetical protein